MSKIAWCLIKHWDNFVFWVELFNTCLLNRLPILYKFMKLFLLLFCPFFSCFYWTVTASFFTLVLPFYFSFLPLSFACLCAFPLLRSLIASLSLQSPGFDTRIVNAGFMVDDVTSGEVFLQVLQFSPVNVILRKLNTHSFLYTLPPIKASLNWAPH